MLKRLRTAALVTVVGALTLGSASPSAVVEAGTASWTPDLVAGESVGITLDGGTARLDPAATHLLPADSDGTPVPTGLLTLPARELAMRTDRVETAVDADLPAGSTAAVDVRGRRDSGGWTEWVPATEGTAALPEPTSEVQTRLVLTGDTAAEPAVRDVTVTAHPASAQPEAVAASAPLNYRVFATREGLTGGTTANGHVIAERDHFVALPSRRALSPRNTSDYSVKVCAPNGRCAFAPVWDVGPWNTRDDYWNPSDQRQEWKDLPQGLPQAQAAHADGYNGGKDQYGRSPSNPAGIDLGDGLFWDALGLKDNAWVSVDYLWTGSVRLSLVDSDDPIDVHAAPSPDAEVVGVAAESAAVPVECATTTDSGTWLRIGADQYVQGDVVSDTEGVASCDTPVAPDVPATDVPATPTSPTTADPATDVVDPATGDPAAADPALADPAACSPAPVSPTTGDPAADGPTTGDPAPVSPTTGDPSVAGPATGEPADSSPTACSPAPCSPVTGDPAVGGGLAVDSAAAGGPATGDPAVGGVAVGDPAPGDPAVGSTTTGAPSTTDPATGDPAVDSPAASSPAVDDPAVCSPTTGDPTAAGPAEGAPTEAVPAVGGVAVGGVAVGGVAVGGSVVGGPGVAVSAPGAAVVIGSAAGGGPAVSVTAPGVTATVGSAAGRPTVGVSVPGVTATVGSAAAGPVVDVATPGTAPVSGSTPGC